MASKGRPFRRFLIDGFEVLVGRGDAENDQLTFRFADPHDMWLHVGGGTAGSHVIVKNPERSTIPRPVIETAAALAAWYSKAKHASRVDVHYCRVADVKKPRGAPAGLVELGRHQRIRVRPAAYDG